MPAFPPQEQDNGAQIATLQAADCDRIFEEKASAGRWDRPEAGFQSLTEAIDCGQAACQEQADRNAKS